MVKIEVFPKMSYGKKMYAFSNKDQEALFFRLTLTRNMTRDKIDALRELGIKVVIIGE